MYKAIAVLAFGAGLLTGCSLSTAGRAVPADHGGPRAVRGSALPEALLGVARINDILETTDVKVQHSSSTLDEMTARLSNPDCVAAFLPAEKVAYSGFEWLAFHGQALRADDGGPSAIQTVTAFSTRSDAQSFFAAMTTQWQRCGQQTIDVHYRDGDTVSWRFGTVDSSDTTLAMIQEAVGSEQHWSCQRGLRLSNNVIVDALACRDYAGDEAVKIVDGIEERLPSV